MFDEGLRFESMVEIGELSFLLACRNLQMGEGLKAALWQKRPQKIAIVGDNIAAVNAMEQHRYTFFFIEDNFPELGGLDFARFVRLTTGPSSVAPIIFALSDPQRESVLAARNAGVNKIVALPLTGQALVNHINAVLTNLRPFVQNSSYNGPCRRTSKPQKRAVERRSADDGLIPVKVWTKFWLS